MLQKILDGIDDGAGQVITLGLSLGSCRVSLSDWKWRRFSCEHNLRADSPTSVLCWFYCAALTGWRACSPGCCGVQGLLSRLLWPVGVRNGPPTLVTTGPVLSPASSIDGCGKGASFPCPCHHKTGEKQGHLSDAPNFGIGSIVLPW